jgi:hypothetical protein
MITGDGPGGDSPSGPSAEDPESPSSSEVVEEREELWSAADTSFVRWLVIDQAIPMLFPDGGYDEDPNTTVISRLHRNMARYPAEARSRSVREAWRRPVRDDPTGMALLRQMSADHRIPLMPGAEAAAFIQLRRLEDLCAAMLYSKVMHFLRTSGRDEPFLHTPERPHAIAPEAPSMDQPPPDLSDSPDWRREFTPPSPEAAEVGVDPQAPIPPSPVPVPVSPEAAGSLNHGEPANVGAPRRIVVPQPFAAAVDDDSESDIEPLSPEAARNRRAYEANLHEQRAMQARIVLNQGLGREYNFGWAQHDTQQLILTYESLSLASPFAHVAITANGRCYHHVSCVVLFSARRSNRQYCYYKSVVIQPLAVIRTYNADHPSKALTLCTRCQASFPTA